MANTLLTPTMITRKALQILHQKCTFIGTINRQYDNRFAVSGAKIGDTLQIRLPNEYTVRTGATLSTQDTTEAKVDLQLATQKGVDVNFTSVDLTMDMDDFASRILEPAMAVLAANIEADAYSMYKDVSGIYDGDASAFSFLSVLESRKLLNDSLAPMDANRTCMLSTAHQVKLIDAVKGLFHDSRAIKQQYREGMIGRTAGFDFYENTHVTDHTTGTAVKTSGYLANDVTPQTGAAITVDTGTTTFLIGDIITFAGVNAVHPESKADLGYLKTFTITADSGASATSLAISPAIVATGAKQNVSQAVPDDAAVTKVGAAASELLNSSMAYHRDAFAIAFADLVMPDGVDFASRQVYDGISMRIVRQYRIGTDDFPCRIDVLYGYKTIREQLAKRIHADG